MSVCLNLLWMWSGQDFCIDKPGHGLEQQDRQRLHKGPAHASDSFSCTIKGSRILTFPLMPSSFSLLLPLPASFVWSYNVPYLYSLPILGPTLRTYFVESSIAFEQFIFNGQTFSGTRILQGILFYSLISMKRSLLVKKEQQSKTNHPKAEYL